MKILKAIFLIFFILITVYTTAQMAVITILDSGQKTSLRGLSVVNDNIVWASGSNGSVARSVNGGKTFEWLTVKNYEQRDFRDIEAFDVNTALIMAIAEPAIILKTKDGGKTWNKIFEDSTKGMFLDAMDFTDNKNGIVVGDPIDKKSFIAYTADAGEHWKKNEPSYAIKTLKDGEAFFAASGTNVKMILEEGKKPYIFYVTGGTASRLFLSRPNAARQGADSIYVLNIIQGKESQGANSIAINAANKSGVIVGGDFSNDSLGTQNCVLINYEPQNLSISFREPQTSPHGYRSCVEYISKDKLIACGTSGVDISTDGGINWELISAQSFHVCHKAKTGSDVFLAASNGKIAKLALK